MFASSVRATLLYVLLFGCSDDHHLYERETLTRNPKFGNMASDPTTFASYLTASPYDLIGCGKAPRTLDQTRELRVFYHPGDYDLKAFTEGLQRYYSRYGLTFFIRHEPVEIPIDWIIDPAPEPKEIKAYLGRRFPGIDLSSLDTETDPTEVPPDLLSATYEFLMQPVFDFVRVYGGEGPAVTNVVLLPQLLRTKDESDEGEMVGLGLSPALVQRFAEAGMQAPDSTEGLFAMSVHLPDGFTPMMFVNGEIVAKVEKYPNIDFLIDTVMAHELGHTLGLTHVSDDRNLMHPKVSEGVLCTLELTPDQIAVAIGNLLQSQDGEQSLATSSLRDASEPALSFDLQDLREYLAGSRDRLIDPPKCAYLPNE